MSINEQDRASAIMLKMGFPETEVGPHVTELRKLIRRQVSEGMTDRSAGTWAPGNHSHEDRAKAFLSSEWSMQRGHSYRVECFDPIIRRSTDLRTMKRSVRVEWKRIPLWLGDRVRETAMKLRIWRDRLRSVTNPYA